jgi:hypothetical protein
MFSKFSILFIIFCKYSITINIFKIFYDIHTYYSINNSLDNCCIKTYFYASGNQYPFIYSEAIVGNPNKIRSLHENENPDVVCISEYNPASANITMLCTGVLVSQTHILTVESCLQNVAANRLEILVGPGDLSRSTSYYSMWWLSFDSWSEQNNRPITTPNNNIAIIKVSYFFKKLFITVNRLCMELSILYIPFLAIFLYIYMLKIFDSFMRFEKI